MFCQNCGTQNPDDGRFCSKCGKDLKSTIQAERNGISGKLGKMGIPGFRSGKTWKMAIAIFGYFWIFLFLIALISPTPAPKTSLSTDSPILRTPEATIQKTLTLLPTPTPTPVPTLPPKTPIIIEKSGTSNTATEIFYLQKGLARITLTYTDMSKYSSNFIVKLLDENGQYKDLLANEIGSYTGTKAIRIEQSGMYLLDITAEGKWNVKIEN